MRNKTVTAIIAAHNRAALTVDALRRFYESAGLAGCTPSAVVYDDGSSDGTRDAVYALGLPHLQILQGDGSAFWAASMSAAERVALEDPACDFVVWLNDDVSLDLDAISRLIQAQAASGAGVVVATVRDPKSGKPTYGGLARSGIHPLAFTLIHPGQQPHRLDAMNGNLVLVTVGAARAIGGIQRRYAHGLADIDYAIRARKMNVGAIVAPGTFGTCARNEITPYPNRRSAWRAFISVKGGAHPASSARLLRQASPVQWPFWWLATYAAWWARVMKKRGPFVN